MSSRQDEPKQGSPQGRWSPPAAEPERLPCAVFAQPRGGRAHHSEQIKEARARPPCGVLGPPFPALQCPRSSTETHPSDVLRGPSVVHAPTAVSKKFNLNRGAFPRSQRLTRERRLQDPTTYLDKKQGEPILCLHLRPLLRSPGLGRADALRRHSSAGIQG